MDTSYETNIFEAEKGFIFILNGQNATLRSTCYEETQLDGSFIVQYKNCTVWINNVEYSDKELVEHDHFTFSLPPVDKITKNQTIKTLSLEKLHLEALSTAGKIINMDNTTHHKFTVTFSAISLILILIAILRICPTPKTIFLPHPTTLPTFVEPAIPSLWSSLHSRGKELPHTLLQTHRRPPNRSDTDEWSLAHTLCA